MMPLTLPPRRRLTSILAEDMADAWSVPLRGDPGQVRFVVDREDPPRPTTPHALLPSRSNRPRLD